MERLTDGRISNLFSALFYLYLCSFLSIGDQFTLVFDPWTSTGWALIIVDGQPRQSVTNSWYLVGKHKLEWLEHSGRVDGIYKGQLGYVLNRLGKLWINFSLWVVILRCGGWQLCHTRNTGGSWSRLRKTVYFIAVNPGRYAIDVKDFSMSILLMDWGDECFTKFGKCISQHRYILLLSLSTFQDCLKYHQQTKYMPER